MLERMLKLKKFINILRIAGDLKDVPEMHSSDWENIQHVTLVLEPFKEAMVLVEGNNYVTASTVVGVVQDIRKKLLLLSGEDQPDTTSKRYAALLLKDFDQRWVGGNESIFDGTVRRGGANRQIGIHPALLVATFLDPRFKNLGSVSDDKDKKAIQNHVLKLMKEVENENRKNAPTLEQVIDQVMEDGDDDDDDDDDEEERGIFARMMEQEQAASQESHNLVPGVESVHDMCQAELNKFLSAERMLLGKRDIKKQLLWNNPLDWWKLHEGKFPTLEVLARKFLAIQASSAPSERIFSQASLLLSAKRTRMKPKIAGKALFVKQNWEHFEGKVDYVKLIGGKEADKFIKKMENIMAEEDSSDDED